MAAYRTWFDTSNTPSDVDHVTLNRAARLMEDNQIAPLSRTDLVALRCAYRPGMSAAEIVAAAEAALDYH